MKYNKLYRWFLTLMLALPIISIAVRCIYVQKNPNAYQSYSGEVKTTNETLATEIQSNLDYQLIYGVYNGNLQFSEPVKVSNLNVITTYASAQQWFRDYLDDIAYIRYFTPNGQTHRIAMYDENLNYIDFWQTSYANQLWQVSFTAESSTTITDNDIMYQVDTAISNTLDNAFEYSVNEFNNVGFNKVNFTLWFTDLFTNGDNIYTTFINSYCNYVLFSTCALALPYFLYWFITFVMGLMDRFGRKEIMR